MQNVFVIQIKLSVIECYKLVFVNYYYFKYNRRVKTEKHMLT